EVAEARPVGPRRRPDDVAGAGDVGRDARRRLETGGIQPGRDVGPVTVAKDEPVPYPGAGLREADHRAGRVHGEREAVERPERPEISHPTRPDEERVPV